MNAEQSSYRHIFKATSLFGGVQVLTILIGIVRTKFVAVFLGTVGVGIMGLLNAPLQLIITVTGLGIAMSAVRDIAEAHGSGDQIRIAKTITTLRRWSWFTGFLGVIVTITLAPLLSQWTFGNREYTWAFIWLSVTLLLQAVSKGQIAILQGTRRLKEMAKASVYGSLIGLFTAVPLYYFFGIKGIVPSLIITAITSLALSVYFSRKVKIVSVRMSYRAIVDNGKDMMKLGLVMTIIGIIGTLTGYAISAFISRTGGVDQVGLYNAGWSIILQSTDLVFAAMSIDYFPRLAAVNHDDSKMGIMVNQQAEMAIIILAPLLILLIGVMPLLIRLLYTPAFLAVVIFANWMVLGILLKALVWSVGFIFPAKGDFKAFGKIEIITLIFNLTTNVLGYKFYGLEGLGISFILDYIFGITLSLIFAHKKYGFKYDKSTIKQFCVNYMFVFVVFLVSYFINQPAKYYYAAIVFLISFTYSFFMLDKRLGLKDLFNELIGKLIKK